VINHTASNIEEVKADIATFTKLLKDPVNLAKAINSLLAEQDRQQQIKLVVTYAGGSATATSDLTAAEADWKSFNPGSSIYYAAIGALGESDINLQLSRLKTFEAAISADSKEVAAATEDAIIPYPQDAVPDDADGIMVFLTLQSVVTKNELVIVAVRSTAVTHVVPYFSANAPHATVTFQNASPQGSALSDLIAGLPAGTKFSAITLWSTTSTIDSGAGARMQSVLAALVSAGRIDANAPTNSQILPENLKAQLTAANISLTGIDDVIALEIVTAQ
jgi:hypothetical protein